jgi:hypothetical protein
MIKFSNKSKLLTLPWKEEQNFLSYPSTYTFVMREEVCADQSGMSSFNLVPRAFLVVARELRKTLVKYDEISKILGDLSHAQ